MVDAIWVLLILVTLTQRTLCESEMWRVKNYNWWIGANFESYVIKSLLRREQRFSKQKVFIYIPSYKK